MEKELCSQMMNNHEEKIEKLDKRVTSLEKTYSIMEKMDYRMSQMENSVARIDQKLDNQQEKKGLKWDKFIDYLFYAILAYALLKLGIR